MNDNLNGTENCQWMCRDNVIANCYGYGLLNKNLNKNDDHQWMCHQMCNECIKDILRYGVSENQKLNA